MIIEVANAHQAGEQTLQQGQIYKPIKIDKYRALLVFDPNSHFGSIAIIIGAATVQIDAEGLTDTNLLIEFAKHIDYSKILETFGY